MAVFRLITSSNLVGSYHRHVGRLLALENPAAEDASEAHPFHLAPAIAHQAAGVREGAPLVARRDRVADRERGDLRGAQDGQPVGRDQERVGLQLR